MEQAETAAEAAHKAHTLPLLGTCYISLNLPNKERNDIEPCAVAPLRFWKPAQKNVEPHPARALHYELWDSHIYIPSTTGGENFAAIVIDTNVELANDPAQATRITHRDVSSPDVNAYRALRISHSTSAPYIDSDRCLTSYSVGMDDGMPRLANTLPRRRKATFALRKADWPASTSSCETLLATASTCLDSRRGILRAAKRHIPHGSRDSPKSI
ncbi:hypothetical protein MOQ_006811 [Trypanosoma cruzi marinkellei]|uniref:Uncharacterized protein n=1 Tax=Trypanosoma cruzi marinkellei TaxID=85056 RepID=K2N401_TRYCR|nr:hypothetical protein MOQ_006811 [Trypanosoma cruzi marinkellei]